MAMRKTVEGNWLELKGTIKNQWGKLTDDDIMQIDGDRERLVGKIMKAYGKSQAEAEEEVNRFWKR